MNANRLAAAALWLISAGIIASAVLGPLVLDVIRFPISCTMEHQLLGGEIASLVLAAPLAAAAGALHWRGHRLASLLAFGPAAYSAYMYVQCIVGQEYSRYDGNSENAFPLYLALIILGWTIAAHSWAALDDARLPDLASRLRRAIGTLLLASNALILLAWIASLADVYGGSPSIEYQRDPQLFWLIRMLDLGFVIPVGLAVGVGLLRSARWANTAGYALVGFQALIVSAVAGMALRMELMDDPSSNPALLVATLILSAAFLILGTLTMRVVLRAAEPPQGAAIATAHPGRHALPSRT